MIASLLLTTTQVCFPKQDMYFNAAVLEYEVWSMNFPSFIIGAGF